MAENKSTFACRREVFSMQYVTQVLKPMYQ
jgi:hypothetical protein